MNTHTETVTREDELTAPVSIPVEAYLSPEYARAERDRLWRKVWLQAGRVEDIPAPGDYLTFDILDDSVLIVRGDDGEPEWRTDRIAAIVSEPAELGRRQWSEFMVQQYSAPGNTA